MPKKYVLKTDSGSLYEVYDETHIFGSDHWILIRQGKRSAVICFGNLRQLQKTHLGGKVTDYKEFLRAMEGEIGNALKTKSCIGKRLIYVDESNFNTAVQWLNLLHQSNKEGDRLKMARIWRAIEQSVGYTSKIVDVFEG